MEETERRTESITVRLISKEQFCKIMDAIHEQDKLMDSICKSLERIADIFSFDVDNKYRKALELIALSLSGGLGASTASAEGVQPSCRERI